MNRREKIEERLRSDPDDVFLNYSYAMELSREDVPAAQAVFEKVRTLDPNYVPAYFQEGQMLAQAGQTDAARDVIRSGIGIARATGDSHALGEMTEFLDSLEEN